MKNPQMETFLDVGKLEEIARDAACFLHQRKGEDIVVMRVRELLPIASFFILASGGSSRAIQTLSGALQKHLKPGPLPRLGVHGRGEDRWICLDQGEVVIHIFQREARSFYDLENLWADAPRLSIDFSDDSEAASA